MRKLSLKIDRGFETFPSDIKLGNKYWKTTSDIAHDVIGNLPALQIATMIIFLLPKKLLQNIAHSDIGHLPVVKARLYKLLL